MSDGNMLLGGRYEIGRLLGRGGMAEVYLASDKRLNRTVAVKVLRSELARDEHFQERFRREAQAAAGLNHPTIVGVYDTGEDHRTEATGEDVTIPFIIMEYVEGETLRHYISPENPMSEQRAAKIMQGVLSALQYSHDAGIVHRDIKPGNVMITKDGEVKVMDFGIARAVAESTANMTQTQAVMGTAQYLSPEQARGQQVDARSDVYSAAVVLYELLTGRPPFTGDSPVSIAYQHVREAPPAPSTFNPNITPAMDAVVLRGLVKDREERYQNAKDFSTDISAVAAGRPPSAFAASAVGAEAATTVLSPADQPTEAIPSESRTQLIPTQTTQMAPADPAPAGTVVAEDEDKKDRGAWVVWVLAILAALALAGLAAWFSLGQDRAPAQVDVPDVVSMTQDEAGRTLTDANLVPQYEEAASEDVEEGTVISTDPVAGTSVDPQSTVTVTVSAGPDAVQVPALVGLSQEDAQKALEDAGLTMSVAGTEDTADVEPGQVSRAGSPEGTSVPSGSEVEVWVSSGQVEVPSVLNLSEDDATTLLEDAKFTVDATSRPAADGETPGTVVEQIPSSGDLQDYGSTVRIVVAGDAAPETVPNVQGATQDQASKRLGDAGFGVTSTTEYSDSVAEGRVIRTEPGANEEVEKGATITIVVSQGPEPTPEPTTPEPTTTEPTQGPTEQPTTEGEPQGAPSGTSEDTPKTSVPATATTSPTAGEAGIANTGVAPRG